MIEKKLTLSKEFKKQLKEISPEEIDKKLFRAWKKQLRKNRDYENRKYLKLYY